MHIGQQVEDKWRMSGGRTADPGQQLNGKRPKVGYMLDAVGYEQYAKKVPDSKLPETLNHI